jgi:hypothetical protein
MGYIISQEKILTKSKKNNNLTKLHTSHAASTTPHCRSHADHSGGFFITSTELRTLRGARVIKDGGSLPVHRAEITLRSGLRTEQKSRFAARGAEILKKGFTDVLK